ncbi:MAG: 50S ribosomal protein L15 [Phycisphaerae bacterium]
MRLDEILKAAGRYRDRKRLGRGIGSGQGKTGGRGTKGAGARSGWRQRIGNEGGQNPILKRIPKRGFTNAGFRVVHQVVNVSDLEGFEPGSRVDVKVLADAGLVDAGAGPVKILGGGALTKKLAVVADQISASAAAKIQQAGGTVEGKITKVEAPPPPPPKVEAPAEKAPKPKKEKLPKDQGGAPEGGQKPPKVKKEKPADAQGGQAQGNQKPPGKMPQAEGQEKKGKGPGEPAKA